MDFLQAVYDAVWGVPTLVLILGVGLWLSARTGFVQLRLLPRALTSFFGRLFGNREQHEGSPFRALCTALAATVGTGNLAGVAGAIALGGPGTIFWIWVCGILGMTLKFAEAALSVRYSRKNEAGETVGGPMHMIRQGLPKAFWPLAGIYSFFGVVAAFGVGNATQINTVIYSIRDAALGFGVYLPNGANLLLGALLSALIGAVLLGGAKRIGQITQLLIPFGAGMYILLSMTVLIARIQAVPQAFSAILQGAFCPRAVTGGVVGSALTALQIGVSRGVFTNEAGMGTAAIAHAAARVEHPAEQGMMGIVEVFLDTIVICTVTALVILCSGVSIPYGIDAGIGLTTRAFSAVLGNWVGVLIAFFMCLFAMATVFGWGLYGIRCAQYLFGDSAWRPFVWLQIVVVVLSAMLSAAAVWRLSEIVNGLMAIPNLIVLFALTPQLRCLVKEFVHQKPGGHYENLSQCQPLRILPHAYVPSSGGSSQGSRQDNLPSEYRPARSADTSTVF